MLPEGSKTITFDPSVLSFVLSPPVDSEGGVKSTPSPSINIKSVVPVRKVRLRERRGRRKGKS